MLQIVSEGTRETRKGNRNISELIFTNNHELISNIYIETSKITDHKYLICETAHSYSFYRHKPESNQEVNLYSYNYLKADWVTINKKLAEIKWEEILENISTSEGKLEIILNYVINIIDEHCEKFKQRGTTRKTIPRDRRILLRNKKKLKKILKKRQISTSRKTNIERFIEDIDKKLLESLNNERYEEEACAIENLKTKPKYFFTYAKKHSKTKSTIGPFKINDELITALDEISNKLLEQYSSTFSVPDRDFSIDNPRDFFSENEESISSSLFDFSFSKEEIITE